MTRKNPPTKSRGSAARSGFGLALAGTVICFGALCCPSRTRRAPAESPRLDARSFPAPSRRNQSALRSIAWLDSTAANEVENYRTCNARQTRSHQFGPIRLIDVGDEVPHLAAFFRSVQRDATARRERCLVVAVLAGCPSCAAFGFALANGELGRALGPLTILRIDLEEFVEELRDLGASASQVPAFALLDAEGAVASVMDGRDWPGNDPGEFLPLLSNFARGLPNHQRGGRYSEPRQGLLEL